MAPEFQPVAALCRDDPALPSPGELAAAGHATSEGMASDSPAPAPAHNAPILVQLFVIDVADEQALTTVQAQLEVFHSTGRGLGIMLGNLRSATKRHEVNRCDVHGDSCECFLTRILTHIPTRILTTNPSPSNSYEMCKLFSNSRGLLYFEADAADVHAVDETIAAMVAEVVQNFPFFALRLTTTAAAATRHDRGCAMM